MAHRFSRSSYNDEALVKYDAGNKELLKGGITKGRVFWLKGLVITNAHAANADQVVIYDDAAELAEAAPTGPAAADRRLTIFCGQADTVVIDYPGPGMKFIDGMVASTLESPAAGTFAAYSIAVTGYEE